MKQTIMINIFQKQLDFGETQEGGFLIYLSYIKLAKLASETSFYQREILV